MKRTNARAALISLFLGLAVVTQAQAEDYYIYQAPNGELVISNRQPPPGSDPGDPDCHGITRR